MPGNGVKRSRMPVHKLAFGAVVSGTGTNMAAVAVSLEIYAQTRSAIWLSVTMICTFGLTGLCSPVAGYLADRFDRKTLMIVVSASTTALWAVLPSVDSKIWLITLVSVANIVDLPYDLAASAAIPNFVDEDELNWATSRFVSAYNFGKLVGPALGALMYTAVGTTAVFEINAATFGFAGVLVLTIPQAFSARSADAGKFEATGEEDLVQRGGESRLGFSAGFRACFADPVITRVLIQTMVACIAVNTALVTNVFLVHDFHAGADAYGLLGATFGLGYLAGSLLAGRVRAGREWRWVIYGAAVLVLSWSIIAVTPWFVLVFAAVFAATAMDSIGGVVAFTLVQRRIEDEVRGRVLSVIDTVGMTANIVGFAVAAVTVKSLGSQGVYGLGAGLCVLGLISLLSYRGNPYQAGRPEEPGSAAVDASIVASDLVV